MLYISNYSSGGGSGTVTNIATGTGLTGGPITATGTISLSTALAPMATLTGNALKFLRVNSGETAVEYAAVTGTGTVTSVTSANADIGVANTTTTPVLTLNSATTATASTITKRDANSNVYVNNYFANSTSTVSAGGTTVLTVASSRHQYLTGSSNQTFQLPDATTLPVSSIFTFNNNSSGSLIITNAGASTQYTVPAGGAVDCFATNVSTANGAWDFHTLAPSATTWSSGVTGLVMNSALTTSPSIGSGASSSTAPSFIPQRGASTTGFGGDGTNLYATIGGTARLTISSSGITATNLSGTNTGDQTSIVGITGTFAQFNTAVTDADLARTDAANTFTGTQTITQIDMGNTDTSITRSAAGVIAIEGVAVPTISSTATITNKRNQPRVVSAASYTTDTGTSLDFSTCDLFVVTAQAGALKFNNPSGTPVHGEKILIRVKDNGTARALTYDTQYRAIGITLPTTTVISKTTYILGIWNATDSKVDCLATGTEA